MILPTRCTAFGGKVLSDSLEENHNMEDFSLNVQLLYGIPQSKHQRKKIGELSLGL